LSTAPRQRRQDQGAAGSLREAGSDNALFIGGAELTRTSPRLPATFNVDVLPVQGINVYDILRRQQAGADQGC
jgi:hypothetical protein